MGGDWHDLGGGLTEGSDSSVSLQPLAGIHDTYERAWAADWIVTILRRERVEITPESKEYIWTALTSLASAPVQERTITGLSVLLHPAIPRIGRCLRQTSGHRPAGRESGPQIDL
jgi:type IV secretion system protein TrbE